MGLIRVLDESVARKIAAGEVIDRPLSIVRELLDNAIDAGADEISCYVEGGGVRRIRVADNGTGMSREDLELSVQPYATSKITSEEDLYRLKTLGFRGEALSSIAACSRLEILTGTGSGEGYCLYADSGKILSIEPRGINRGTIVDVGDLFHTLPARRKFLKRTVTESQLCRRHFIEKTLPFSGITFRYFNDNQLDLFLPAGDRKQRFADAWHQEVHAAQLLSGHSSQEGLHLDMIAGRPGLHKKNRSLIQIYINNRRIDEYAFTQAVQYAYAPYLPGGLFPVCVLFLEIPPDEVDFNVHPSKREARFRDIQGIHRFITRSLQDLLSEFTTSAEPVRPLSVTSYQKEWEFPVTQAPFSPQTPATRSGHTGTDYPSGSSDGFAYTELKELPRREIPITQDLPFRYLGQVFRCFLAVEKGGSFYLIDQHAAHERILYDRFLQKPPLPQNLLVPLDLEWETGELQLLERHQDEVERAGFLLEVSETSQGSVWRLTGIPAVLGRNSSQAVGLLRQSLTDSSHLSRELFSSMACRAAVKDQDVLDELTARDLIEGTFSLPQPRCPHGRPVWFRLDRGELEGLVGRTVT